MSLEHVHRSQLVAVQVKRLALEARTCDDPERLAAIQAELDLLHTSVLDIREEQLLEHFAKRQPEPRRRRWWRR